MSALQVDVVATHEAFDEAGYLSVNADVARAVAAGELASGRQHFELFGAEEARPMRRVTRIAQARRRKIERLEPLLRHDLPHERHGDVFDYLTDDLRALSRFATMDHISANPYEPNVEALIAACAGGLVLDCGAGRRPVYYDDVVNLEQYPYDTTDVVGVGQALPFVDNAFDAVLSLTVIEYAPDPFVCARELARVLKPGGRLICTAPSFAPMNGYPTHYFNPTRFGLQALFDDALVIDDQRVVESMLPVWTLCSLLASWARGLDGDARDKFLSLEIGAIAATPPWQLTNESWVTGLDTAKNFELASATMLFAHKPDRAIP